MRSLLSASGLGTDTQETPWNLPSQRLLLRSRLDHRLTRLVAVHLLLWLASVSVFAYASWSHYTREARTLGSAVTNPQPWQTAFPSISDARSTVRMILQFSLVPEKYESDDRVFHLMTAIRLAQLILLAFWAGMGTSRIAIRILGTLVGLVVVASGPLLVQISFPYDCMCVYELKVGNRVVPRTGYPPLPKPNRVVRPIGLLVRLHAPTHRRIFPDAIDFLKLRRLPMPIAPSPPAPFQYSLRHFMVLVVIASAVFGLFRSTLLFGDPVAAGAGIGARRGARVSDLCDSLGLCATRRFNDWARAPFHRTGAAPVARVGTCSCDGRKRIAEERRRDPLATSGADRE